MSKYAVDASHLKGQIQTFGHGGALPPLFIFSDREALTGPEKKYPSPANSPEKSTAL